MREVDESDQRQSVVDLRRRIERGEPASYWEENLVECRRVALAKLFEWAEPVSGRSVLDLRCGAGSLARALCHHDAHVTACDWDPEASPDAERAAGAQEGVRGGPPIDWRHEHPVGLLERAVQPFDDVVIWAVLEDLGEKARHDLLAALERLAPERLFVALHLESGWTRFAPGLVGAAMPTADPVEILRSIHLETSLRLERQETARRRNATVRLMQLRRLDPGQ